MKDVILLTGGTGKIGSSLIYYLANLDCKIVFTGRNQSKINSLINEVNQSANVFGFEVDHKDINSINQLINELNKINLLPTHIINNVRDVNNLSLDTGGKPTYEAWINEFYLGVILPYELALGVLQKKSNLKKIINISSMYGLVAANPNLYENPATDSPIHYGIVKAAQNHLTKELAVRLAKYSVSVNSVAYGGVEGRVDEQFKQRYATLCPQGRMLKTSEVPGIIKYLLFEAEPALTGQIIAVDGGWSIW